MSEFTKWLAYVRQQLEQRGEPNTDRQRKWVDHLTKTERLVSEAINLEHQVAASPDDTRLRNRFLVRKGQAKLAMDQIRTGVESHKRNYERAHGGTAEECRAGWRDAYAKGVMKREGREVRRNKRHSDMTPEELTAHKRKLAKEAKARYRAKKALEGK